MKKQIFALVTSFLLVPVAYSLTTTIIEGTVTDLGINEILTFFGMVKGTITFKLGSYTWPASEIWFLPEGTSPKQFKSSSTYLEIPENITSSTCKTSVYYNETYGYAFKVLSSQVMPDGSFCGLAYNGTYEILAKS